jgi:UDP-glucose 4-epimerase
MLHDFDRAYGLRFVALRYFNAAGATRERGEHHDPEPHLIPLALAAAAGLRPRLSVFGTDYPTPDGTAVRDYIHIEDLGEAHLLALRHLRGGGDSEYLNLANGTGYSVLEVIEAPRKVTGLDVPFENTPRREGDPPRLVGDARRAAEVLGWKPKRPGLEEIIRSAWQWQQSHPDGYA